jgi:hypothetical protein
MTEEARLQRIEERLAALVEQVSGGPTITWDRSVRGRLHKLTEDANASRLTAAALAQLRATEDKTLSRTEKRAVIAFGALQSVITVATLILLVLHG